jgi:hypothetical protein
MNRDVLITDFAEKKVRGLFDIIVIVIVCVRFVAYCVCLCARLPEWKVAHFGG